MPLRTTRLKDHWQEQQLFLTRVIAAAVIIVLLSGLLVARLVVLQVVEYERFSELSQGNRFRLEPLPPTRGLVYDRNGVVIADNLPSWELVAIAEEVGNLDATLKQLEALGLVDPSEHKSLRDLMRSHRGFERVKLSNLTEEQAATFAVRRHRFPGVDIQEALSRHYPFGEASAHAIGYVGSISLQDLERIDRSDYASTSHIGKTGIERSYENALHGHVGYRHQVVNAQGRVLFDPSVQNQADEAEIAGMPKAKQPVPGNNIVLSIDMRLQLAAQAALGEVRGAVVAIDPRNGDVLALVSTPAFDPNRFAEGMSRQDYVALNTDPDRPLFNRALAGTYPPGSTVKPFIALAALEHGDVLPRRIPLAGSDAQIPRRPRRRARQHEPARSDRALVRRLLLSARDRRRHQRPFGRIEALRSRRDDGARHQRRAERRHSVGRVEEEAVPAPRGPNLVPGRHDQRGRRPGLRARHAPAARERGRRHGSARQTVHAALADRH
jgi:penicillin-binding protein 2